MCSCIGQTACSMLPQPTQQWCASGKVISEWPSCFLNSYSASHDNWCTATLWNRIMTAQCEGMGEVGSARYEPALLPPMPEHKGFKLQELSRDPLTPADGSGSVSVNARSLPTIDLYVTGFACTKEEGMGRVQMQISDNKLCMKLLRAANTNCNSDQLLLTVSNSINLYPEQFVAGFDERHYLKAEKSCSLSVNYPSKHPIYYTANIDTGFKAYVHQISWDWHIYSALYGPRFQHWYT